MDLNRQILNTSINLNIWYELPSEIVYYWRIEDSTHYEQKKKKKEINEQERKSLLNEEQRLQAEQEQAERQRFVGLIKETIEKYWDFLLSEENSINQTIVDFKTDPEKIFDQEYCRWWWEQMSKLQTPEMLFVSRATHYRPITDIYEMEHKKYVAELSDFVLRHNNDKSIIISIIHVLTGRWECIECKHG